MTCSSVETRLTFTRVRWIWKQLILRYWHQLGVRSQTLHAWRLRGMYVLKITQTDIRHTLYRQWNMQAYQSSRNQGTEMSVWNSTTAISSPVHVTPGAQTQEAVPADVTVQVPSFAQLNPSQTLPVMKSVRSTEIVQLSNTQAKITLPVPYTLKKPPFWQGIESQTLSTGKTQNIFWVVLKGWYFTQNETFHSNLYVCGCIPSVNKWCFQARSLCLPWQVEPLYPGTHKHDAVPAITVHVPPWLHVRLSQAWTGKKIRCA